MPKFLSDIDLSHNQLLNTVIENTSDLNSIQNPIIGQVVYLTLNGNKHLYAYNGTSWVLADSSDAAKNVFLNVTDGVHQAIASGLSDTLTITSGTGISAVINPVTKALTITNTDLGSSQNIFKNISDGTNLAVADQNSDTLVFSQGGGLDVLVNPTNDSVTYSHANTSSQLSITEAPRTYISGVTVDDYGHVTGLTTDPEIQYSISAETAIGGAAIRLSDTKVGTPDNVTLYAEAGIQIIRTDESQISIGHASTSSVTSIETEANNFLSGLTFDEFGHVTGVLTAESHAQNTDTGTTSETFVINSTSLDGVSLTNLNGELQIKDITNTSFANLRVKDLYVEGTQTVINSNTVNIGDSEIELNSDITTYDQNSNGGISLKRFYTDNSTRKDAKITYSEASNRWQTTFGAISGTLITAQLANKVVYNLGDGVNNAFVVSHNLNTRDLTVTMRQTSGDYAIVYSNIEFTSLNTLTVKFTEAPATNEYIITIVG